MKKHLLILFLFLASLPLLKAQYTSEQLKSLLAGKKWSIVKYETFSVISEPNSEQFKDIIQLNSDMTFVVVENGKEYKGKWTIGNPTIYITCKATVGWSKTFKVISVNDKEAVIEYKDPDLIKTKYYLVQKE